MKRPPIKWPEWETPHTVCPECKSQYLHSEIQLSLSGRFTGITQCNDSGECWWSEAVELPSNSPTSRCPASEIYRVLA